MGNYSIKIYRTTELSEELKDNYFESITKIFDISNTKDELFETYRFSSLGYSYHCFLQDDDNKVLGSITAKPFSYHCFDRNENLCLAVGVFILPDHRKDPLQLFKMYREFKKYLQAKAISAVIAVPNDTSFAYWTKVVKWTHLGKLDYFVLPLSLGKLTGKTILNWFPRSVLKYASNWLTFFQSNQVEISKPIRINKESISEFRHFRYQQNHFEFSDGKYYYSYGKYVENGIQTLYLIDFKSEFTGVKDSKSLHFATSELYKLKPDLIIYVGQLNFKQYSLIRLPNRKEPKLLPFTIDILDKSKLNQLELDWVNWDFGLFNYDVR